MIKNDFSTLIARFTLFFAVFVILLFNASVKTFAFEQVQKISSLDDNKLVRVAISNNDFKSYVYDSVSVVSQADCFVYEKESAKQLAKFSPTDTLNIKIKDGAFELKIKDKVIASQISGSLVIDCPKGMLGVENLKRKGKQALYHGYFEVNRKNETQFLLINVIDLESYLKGVVPNEMPTRFGLEALKAQAIAARNYVLTPRVRSCKDFDVDDSVSSQVYFGANTEEELSNKAVDETRGLVALYDWDLILAQYSSTAGGYTENYENAFSDPKTKEFPPKGKPFLIGRPDILSVAPLNREEEEAKIFYMSYPDSYDMKSPYYRWQKQWEAKELQEVLEKTLIVQSKTGFVKPEFKEGEKLSALKELKVLRRGVSGKIMELEIITDKETYHVKKELVIRRLLPKNGISLPSANVVFENLYDADKKLNKIIAYGGGFGHGVGMSQYGAGFMATSLHKSFDNILKRYYSGITISTCPLILSNHATQKTVAQVFYAPYKKATLVIDNKYQIENFNANINGNEVSFSFEKSLLPTHRISRIDISEYIRIGQNKIIFYYPEEYGDKKALRLYVELVEKDNEYNF